MIPFGSKISSDEMQRGKLRDGFSFSKGKAVSCTSESLLTKGVMDLFGVLLGGACGAAELFLLCAFVDRVTAQKPLAVWMIPLKIIVLIAFLVPCGLLWPKELPVAGISAAAILIVGAVICFACTAAKQKKLHKRGGDFSDAD